ncbi:MAG: hypothetical protein RI538_04735, partial [Salibaculum sp.]
AKQIRMFVMYMKSMAILATAVFVSGCVDPKSMETTPVQVSTSHGTVTCQLYTRSQVTWDRAIDRPDSMSVDEADEICLAEGKRRANQS